MSSSVKSVSLAVDVVVVCVLITLAIYVSRTYKRTVQVATENMNGTTVEYMDASIVEMLGNVYTGADVKNYIKKYRRDMQVEVRTLQHPTGTVYNASVVYAAVNTDNVDFIANDAAFVCDGAKDTNGNYASLIFTQQGSIQQGGVTVTTPEDAQTALIQKLGLSGTASWQDVVNAVNAQDNTAAKQTLVNSLGGSFNMGSSWSSLATEISHRMLQYQQMLNASTIASSHNASGSVHLSYQDAYSLTFVPDLIVARFSSEPSKVYVWMSGAWVGDSLSMEITPSGSGVVLKHVDSTKQTAALDVVAYN